MAQVFYSLCETIIEQTCVVLRNHCDHDKNLRKLDKEYRRLTGIEPANGESDGELVFVRGDDADALADLQKVDRERREMKEVFERSQSHFTHLLAFFYHLFAPLIVCERESDSSQREFMHALENDSRLAHLVPLLITNPVLATAQNNDDEVYFIISFRATDIIQTVAQSLTVSLESLSSALSPSRNTGHGQPGLVNLGAPQ